MEALRGPYEGLLFTHRHERSQLPELHGLLRNSDQEGKGRKDVRLTEDLFTSGTVIKMDASFADRIAMLNGVPEDSC